MPDGGTGRFAWPDAQKRWVCGALRLVFVIEGDAHSGPSSLSSSIPRLRWGPLVRVVRHGSWAGAPDVPARWGSLRSAVVGDGGASRGDAHSSQNAAEDRQPCPEDPPDPQTDHKSGLLRHLAALPDRQRPAHTEGATHKETLTPGARPASNALSPAHVEMASKGHNWTDPSAPSAPRGPPLQRAVLPPPTRITQVHSVPSILHPKGIPCCPAQTRRIPAHESTGHPRIAHPAPALPPPPPPN